MHFSFKGISLIVVLGMSILLSDCLYGQDISLAPAPLYRDPYTDGAADPTVFWNHHEQEWWMFYTQRRANDQSADVAFCYGNRIGIVLRMAEILSGLLMWFTKMVNIICFWPTLEGHGIIGVVRLLWLIIRAKTYGTGILKGCSVSLLTE
jgi:hypothetical protein